MKRIDVLDLPEDARDLIRECEARGERTLFERKGRPVAMLVSHDEYTALRETIEIANDSLLFARLAEADESTSLRVDEASRGRGHEEAQPPDRSSTRKTVDATTRLADESTSLRVDEASRGRGHEEAQSADRSATRKPVDATTRLERLVLADNARAGLDALTGVVRRRALSALARINSDPISGAPLFEPLKGLWSYRTEELRIVYKIVAEARVVVVMSVERV